MKKMLVPLWLALLAASAQAEVRLSNVFGEHMVLQRDRPLRLWGTATPGQTLTVDLAGRTARTQVGADGRWRVELPPLSAGGPFHLLVQGDQAVELSDVLIGDVWLLGGQSNMELPLAATDTGAQEVASPQNPQLRELRVPRRASVLPEAEIARAPWVVAEPGRVDKFSAVGYHFARQIEVSRHWWLIDGGLKTFSSPHRYVSPGELDLMARIAGLSLCERWNDWHRRPFTGESRSHVSVWKKAV